MSVLWSELLEVFVLGAAVDGSFACEEDKDAVAEGSAEGAGAVTVIVAGPWAVPLQLVRMHAVAIMTASFVVRLIIGSPFPSIYAHMRRFLEAYMTKFCGRFWGLDCDD